MKYPIKIFLPLLTLPAALWSQTVYFDFGTTYIVSDSETWNEFTVSTGQRDSVGNGTGPALVFTNDLLDSTGASTGFGFSMTDTLTGTNNTGAQGSGVFPDGATRDSLYGTGDGAQYEFNNFIDNGKAVFVLSNLNPAMAYDFTFYGSRDGVSDNRDTLYSLLGTNSGSNNLNTANNVSSTVAVSGIVPTAGGEITLTVGVGPNNDNGNRFYYIGAMEMVGTTIPEPQTYAAIVGMCILGLSVVRRRRK